MLLLLIALALGVSFPQVDARLSEIEEYRAMRLAHGAPKPNADVVKRASGGTVVTGLYGNMAWAAAVLNVPIGQLWAGLNDETRHPPFTAMGHSEILTGAPCQSGRSVFNYLPIPMVSDRWWVSHIRANDQLAAASGNSVRELTWFGTMEPSAVTSASGKKFMKEAEPIGSTRGAWFMVAIDQFNTYVEYFSATDPGAGVPSSLANRLAARGVHDQVLAIKKFATQGSPVCPVY